MGESNCTNAIGRIVMIKRLSAPVWLLFVTTQVLAGTWGAENWGEMYWGDNPVSTPTAAPSILSIQADGNDLIVTIGDYAVGDDGWSAITGYNVACGEADAVVSSASTVRIEGLQSDTEYACTVVATNSQGNSPESLPKLAVTDPELQGLNMVIIRAALCSSGSPPENC